VTHPEFVPVGSRSPVENSGVHGPTSDITTNYQEMITDHTKKLITIGLPDHVNLDENLTVGSKYEDPVFVNEKGQEISATEAVAESEQQNALGDAELEKVEEELSALQAENADQAHELIMSKHTDILRFLATIAKSAKLNTVEEKLFASVKKYLDLLLSRHFLIKG